MNHRHDPPHDRVALTAAERAAVASLERWLREEDTSSGALGPAPSTTVGRLGRPAARLVRLSPWLALAALLALAPAIAASQAAGITCALVLTAALTTWLVGPSGRVSRWLAGRGASSRQPQRGRARGHP